MSHFKKICKECVCVISQCRCPGPKEVIYGTCKICEKNKESKKMNFAEALQAMKEGKKVTRSVYQSGIYFTLNNKYNIRKWDGLKYYDTEIFIDDFEATDWEIFEEKKCFNLEEKEILSHQNSNPENIIRCFPIDDVKECKNLILGDLEIQNEIVEKKDFSKDTKAGIKDGLYIASIIINNRFGDMK